MSYSSSVPDLADPFAPADGDTALPPPGPRSATRRPTARRTDPPDFIPHPACAYVIHQRLPDLAEPFAPAGDDADLATASPDVRDPPPSGPPG